MSEAHSLDTPLGFCQVAPTPETARETANTCEKGEVEGGIRYKLLEATEASNQTPGRPLFHHPQVPLGT